MPPTPTNGHPPPGRAADHPPPDPLAEAEAVRGLLAEAAARLGGLVAALKHQRKHARALRQVADALGRLPPLPP